MHTEIVFIAGNFRPPALGFLHLLHKLRRYNYAMCSGMFSACILFSKTLSCR